MHCLFSVENSVQAVNQRLGPEISPRLATVMRSLVSHLHAFIKDVEITPTEWAHAIDFLTRTGQTCSDVRQEFILLSDTLGVSMLVDAISNRRTERATENTVLGPFHVDGAPERAMGDTISLDSVGEACEFIGQVRDLDGNPVAGAKIDVWSDNGDGFYDVQQPDIQPQWNNRGIFRTGPDGRYRFRGIKPVSYPIPDDGPVGQMLQQLGRHPYRPAHLHFIIEAEGFETVITHTFVDGDSYLDSDAVFGVKGSLIASYQVPDGAGLGWRSNFDFVLVPLE
jgi:protocatechuate 3,4-dioxygenase beta subunit